MRWLIEYFESDYRKGVIVAIELHNVGSVSCICWQMSIFSNGELNVINFIEKLIFVVELFFFVFKASNFSVQA